MNINRRGFFGLVAAAIGYLKFGKTDYIPAKLPPQEYVLPRNKLTELYISPEAMEDIRNWTISEIDSVARREIYSC